MIDATEIRHRLIDRLAPIFGNPKNADGLASELAKVVAKNAEPSSLDQLANRIIQTRKTKGFPPASELIAEVKAIAHAGPAAVVPTDDGTVRFDGPAPVTWVPGDDPRWSALCDLARKDNPRFRMTPTSSKHAPPGYGWYFRSEYVDAMPLTTLERERLKSARASKRFVPGLKVAAE